MEVVEVNGLRRVTPSGVAGAVMELLLEPVTGGRRRFVVVGVAVDSLQSRIKVTKNRIIIISRNKASQKGVFGRTSRQMKKR